MSSAGSAPQFSVTNGPSRTLELAWMISAMRSLPLPFGPGDQHRHVGARDLAGQLQHALGRGVAPHEAAQVELRLELALRRRSRCRRVAQRAVGLRQLDQVRTRSR